MVVKQRTREGYKMTELGEIPVEWEVKKLGELGSFSKGKGIAKKDLTESGHLCILYGELYTKYLDTINEVVSRTIIEPPKSILGKQNDVLIPSSGETPIDIATASALNVDDVLLGGDINIFRPNKDIIGSYISYSINSVRKTDLAKLAQGSSVYHLYSSSLSEFDVFVPPLKEQQKIAEILTTIDKQIENTDQLIEKTKELKKGLMQQLLASGIGHTQFKKTEHGEIPMEWEVVQFKDIFQSIKSGISRRFSPQDIGYPVIRSSNIKNNLLDLSDLKYWYLTDPQGSELESLILDKGDILLNFINSLAQIGKCCIFDAYDRDYIYTTNIFRVKVQKEKAINKFFYYYSQTKKYEKDIQNIVKPAVNQASFTKADFEQLSIPIPHIEEQQKIVEILSSVDEQIDYYVKEKEKYMELKKGLMQKLLTGKLRVAM